MDPRQSLTTFFQVSEPSTLDNCDQERIHLSGAIQNTGALLLIDPDTQKIVGASENAAQLLGMDPIRLSEARLEDVHPDLAAEVASVVDDANISHEALDFQLHHEGIVHDTVTHSHDGRRLIEFVPNSSPTALCSRRNMRICSKACTSILNSDSFDEALQTAVDAIRQISGFARVKIYRFQPDWSGKVIAESNDGSLPSYLGLHFPERDIPRQVRHLMTMVPYRGIGTVDNDNLQVQAFSQLTGKNRELDLTWSVLRSVSPMHTQYLSNMGIAATFSTSLMHKQELWGLIACHNTSPGILPFDSWGLLHEMGTSLMIRYAQEQYADVTRMSHRLRLIESEFSSALQKNGRVEDIIEEVAPSLQEFLQADGFAFLYGSQIYLSGNTPPESVILALVDWAEISSESSNQYHSAALQDAWPPASAHRDTACGVLIQSTTLQRVCQLVWFRGPATRTVNWAGQPKPKTSDALKGTSPLNPRASFDQWVEEHAEQSVAWSESELLMAREILRDFLDILTSQMLINQENQYLRQFAASAVHDLNTPLRGINAALNIMHEEGFDEDVVKQTHAIATKSARRLSDLTSGLMELSMTTEDEQQHTRTDLGQTIKDVLGMLAQPIRETGAKVIVDEMPILLANDALLLRLFLNLIGNAIKYRHPERAPLIHISCNTENSDFMRIAVTDNGLGIPHKFARRIFQPLERLHTNESIEGSGLGLTICQRVAEAHSGTIELDIDHTEGSRFILSLPLAA